MDMQLAIPFPPRRWRPRLFILGMISLVLWLLLPYDNTLVLLFRWHVKGTLDRLTASEEWRSHPLPYPFDMDDVGIVIKTGYTTQERLLARLDAFHDANVKDNLLLVGDYATAPGSHFNHSGVELPVHNVIASLIQTGAFGSKLDGSRLKCYHNLTDAIVAENENLARTIGERCGWELDILKHVSGLELLYNRLPHKKWYIMLDDDSYVLDPSLQLVLGHVNPAVPHYIGNAVGDFKARFAHGGSVVVLSQAAMHRIFVQNPEIVMDAHEESLEIQWGDKLIATTAMKCGVYLEEKYKRHFNGEAPLVTRIRSDRFCWPIVSFHKMSPAQLTDVGRMFKDIKEAVSWVSLWRIYGAPALEDFRSNPSRSGWDHVGRLDEVTMTTKHVNSKEGCLKICQTHGSTCLAWTWESASRLCHISPWMIIGEPAPGKVSGINEPRATSLLNKCHE